MRILLINPPGEHPIQSEVPAPVNREVCLLPPLGLLYLESYLAAHHPEHDVRVMDSRAECLSHEDVSRLIGEFQPRVVGITGHTYDLIDMRETSRRAKAVLPGVTVFWGGPHATQFADKCMRFEELDVVVRGEGEITFAESLAHVETGDFSTVKGLLFRYGDRITDTGERPPAADLDVLPHPRRDILDIRKYYYVLGREEIVSSIVSSRGCPYRCTFCSTPGKRFRTRSPRDLVDELEACVALGIREFYFVDDTFNADIGRVLDICDEIGSRELDISWNFRARADSITPELVRACEAAGCTRIQVGVETSSDEGMEVLGKDITLEQVMNAFALLGSSRITSAAYFMIGCPHEKTLEDIERTVNFAISLDPDYCLFGVLTPYPGTVLYEKGVASGALDPDRWERFLQDPNPEFRPPVWTEHMGEKELTEYLDMAYKRFYLRPGYILKRLKEVKSLGTLGRKIRAGLSILRL